MNDYYEVRLDLNPCSEDATDLLAGMLADEGYESFVPDEDGLTAYVKKETFSDEALKQVLNDFPFDSVVTASTKVIEGQDWNAEWEKNYFQPIVIGDQVVVHSSFHSDIPQAKYDIVIDPKMAFGTGHHSTTSQIMSALLSLELEGKSVIDMGTGTGILAILAAMRGASPVCGIEIDQFAYENALENVSLNNHPEINLINGDASALEGIGIATADIFIANINRNVILADLHNYAKTLKSGGIMLLSGFYEGGDCDMITEEADKYGLKPIGQTSDNRWACLKLQKI